MGNVVYVVKSCKLGLWVSSSMLFGGVIEPSSGHWIVVVYVVRCVVGLVLEPSIVYSLYSIGGLVFNTERYRISFCGGYRDFCSKKLIRASDSRLLWSS